MHAILEWAGHMEFMEATCSLSLGSSEMQHVTKNKLFVKLTIFNNGYYNIPIDIPNTVLLNARKSYKSHT